MLARIFDNIYSWIRATYNRDSLPNIGLPSIRKDRNKERFLFLQPCNTNIQRQPVLYQIDDQNQQNQANQQHQINKYNQKDAYNDRNQQQIQNGGELSQDWMPPQTTQKLQKYYYKLVIEEYEDEQQMRIEVQQKQTEQFLEKLRIMDENQRTVQKMLEKMTIDDDQLQKMNQFCHNIDKTMEKLNDAKNQSLSSEYLTYMKIVLRTVDTKYKRQIQTDYRPLTFEQYKYITKTIWRSDLKEQVIDSYEHLKYKDIKLLAYGEWLNDQIISDYLKILFGSTSFIYVKRKYPVPRFLDSLQTKSIFEKANHDRIKRILMKNKINLSENDQQMTEFLYLVIHKVNHWLFLKLNLKERTMKIYDSMCSTLNAKEYLKFKTIENVVEFFNSYFKNSGQYQLDPHGGNLSHLKIQICHNYPQQSNGYDCGMMMLCGIRDLVRGLHVWTFTQSDIKYKRILTTMQLMEHKIYGIQKL